MSRGLQLLYNIQNSLCGTLNCSKQDKTCLQSLSRMWPNSARNSEQNLVPTQIGWTRLVFSDFYWQNIFKTY